MPHLQCVPTFMDNVVREMLAYETCTYIFGELLVFFERLGQLSLRRVQFGSDRESSSGSYTKDRSAD